MFVRLASTKTILLCPVASARGGTERSGCAYVHLSEVQIKIFVQGRISRPVKSSKLIFHNEDVSLWDQQEYTIAMTSWPIFLAPLTSDFGQIIKVMILSKVESQDLLVVASWYFIWICRSIIYQQEYTSAWPPNLYFMVCWLQTLAEFPWLRFLS